MRVVRYDSFSHPASSTSAAPIKRPATSRYCASRVVFCAVVALERIKAIETRNAKRFAVNIITPLKNDIVLGTGRRNPDWSWALATKRSDCNLLSPVLINKDLISIRVYNDETGWSLGILVRLHL